MVSDSRPKLLRAGRALGVESPRPGACHGPPELPAYSYMTLLSWVALNADRAAAGLASFIDIEGYYATSLELAAHLREAHPGMPEEVIGYFGESDGRRLGEEALALADTGLAEGADPRVAVHVARLTDEALGQFWSATAR
ncbi:hypothetical protein [Spongiactinospora sp. 9N601]|uniref:hypothetical protein n=1 Tax=Spongiactinospora sp. 9N601 TaxID=3375149 RepID=UPI0037916A58